MAESTVQTVLRGYWVFMRNAAQPNEEARHHDVTRACSNPGQGELADSKAVSEAAVLVWLRRRQKDFEACPATVGGKASNRSFMALGNLADEREPEPHTAI